ncbi:MAG: phthalate 4,5-cis-dihydrodiol dehydrogenase [Chloroflexota bacterium]|nr:phthalate 4,5-cis-dihydrodiol dehydrogenase [Chloroflexota bacterium]
MAETTAQATAMRPGGARVLKVGIIGIGVGSTEVMPAMEAMDEIEVVAGCDVVPETLQKFGQRFPGAKLYDDIEKMCADPDVEAVWISSPNRFHAPHTITAAQHGKHVVVEKPMAISIAQAESMCAAADTHGVKLLAGHTRSFTLPLRAMRKVVTSGRIGKLCAIHIWSYSDWMLRPRTPDELDLAQGGGVPYRQGPHQIDTVRVIGGGMLKSVRGMTGQWMPERPIPGYYTAYLEFEDGTPSTIMHNGYGYFIGAEFVPWGRAQMHYSPEEKGNMRRQMRAGSRPEAEQKQAMRIGGSDQRQATEPGTRRPWVPEDMGFIVVSCERGDIRHSQYGIYIYDDDGIHDVDVELEAGGVGRRAELEELYNAVVLDKPVYHDGRWGMATLEVSLAIMQSAKEHREIQLTHQVPVSPDYDADLKLTF